MTVCSLGMFWARPGALRWACDSRSTPCSCEPVWKALDVLRGHWWSEWLMGSGVRTSLPRPPPCLGICPATLA